MKTSDSLLNRVGKLMGLNRAARRAAGFHKDEGGVMIVFALSIFIMMLWVGGMAIDFMRFEHQRALISYTADRAALAAASLNQPLDCEVVARDYFEKSSLDTDNIYVDGVCNPLSKTVLVAAETNVNSLFLNLLGIDSMQAASSSVAREFAEDIEISLVLDVSGSMSENDASGARTKLKALEVAAAEFLDLMLLDTNRGRVSINVIPYSTQVSLGADVLDQLNVSDEHEYSHCVNFEAADFETTEITSASAGIAEIGGGFDFSSGLMAVGDELERTAHFDLWTNAVNHPNISSDDETDNDRIWVCNPEDWAAVTLMSENKQQLKDAIAGFEAGGNTSIDLGVKWGAYFLNPSSNRLIQNLPDGSINLTKDGDDPTNADGSPVLDGDGQAETAPVRVPAAFSERPHRYGRENTQKILIVMSDGINTTQFTLREDWREGASPVYYDQVDVDSNSGNNYFSMYEPIAGDNNDYFMSRGSLSTDYFDGSPFRAGGELTNLSWPELMQHMSVYHYVVFYNWAKDFNYSTFSNLYYGAFGGVDAPEKDERLNDVCTAAKDEDITIFTIGFEVSEHSADVLRKCATKDTNYFNVEGAELEDAFGKIAKTIQRLQLTN